MKTGGCHCGAVRYAVEGDPIFVGICHCVDCRRNAGAVSVAWIAFPANALSVESGRTTEYVSHAGSHRHFCSKCGTGLFYYNQEFLPDVVDIQLTTLDDCDKIMPQMHIQVADALPWEGALDGLPCFERYPDALVHFH